MLVKNISFVHPNNLLEKIQYIKDYNIDIFIELGDDNTYENYKIFSG
jgi:hypothetical protein